MDSAPSQEEDKDFAQRFRDHFETLVPEIQRRWPEVTHQALEATRGSFDEVVHLIASQGDRAVQTVQQQLEDLMHQPGESVRSFADTLEPLEEQLEQLLDDLNSTLRPKIERPVRERPLLALAIAAGVGVSRRCPADRRSSFLMSELPGSQESRPRGLGAAGSSDSVSRFGDGPARPHCSAGSESREASPDQRRCVFGHGRNLDAAGSCGC